MVLSMHIELSTKNIDTYFLKNGFKKCRYDPNIYVKNFDDDVLIVVLYADDLILTGNQLTFTQEMKNNLKKQFEKIESGLLHYFLGL